MARAPLVLLLPSDPITGLLTQTGLQSYGYDVLLALTSAEASQALLTAKNIRVLVIDADQPGGLAVAKAARAADPRVAVIYASREPNRLAEREKVREAPCLRVPYHPHQLVSVIGSLLRRPGADERETDAA
jgi:DNA-binding response OmpR family regulator